MPKEVVLEKPKSSVAKWLRISSYVFIVLNVLYGFISKSYYPGILIGSFIAVLCGNKCAEWAVKIKKSPNWAYCIGLFFMLLGLLEYYIYYKIKINRKISPILKIMGWIVIGILVLLWIIILTFGVLISSSF